MKMVVMFSTKIVVTIITSGIALKSTFAPAESGISPKIERRKTDMSPSMTNEAKGRKKNIPISMETIRR